jgi:hypothetical protein
MCPVETVGEERDEDRFLAVGRDPFKDKAGAVSSDSRVEVEVEGWTGNEMDKRFLYT